MSSRPTPNAIVIGASAGAIEALSAILPALTSDFRIPIIVVIHLPPDRVSIAADLFDAKCQLRVKEAEDKEPIEPGTVYFAPPDYHVLVEPDNRISLSIEEPVMFSRPSIDVLFESAAHALGLNLLAIILTGANSDGAKGLQKVVDEGGHAIVQSPDSALSRAMPAAAIAACPTAQVLDLLEIREYLQQLALEEAS